MNPDAPFSAGLQHDSPLPGLSLNPEPTPPPRSSQPDNPPVMNRPPENRRQVFKVIRFMFEASIKLEMKSVPLATACMIFHRVVRNCNLKQYDPYLLGTTALYLGGKVEEQHVKLRDVINVCHHTLHPNESPLDIGSTYWSLRESVAQCELFLMRVLRFRVSFSHPHKYLVYYIKSVQDWLTPGISSRVPLAHTAWALLRDSYHGDICLRYDPAHIAVSVLYMALQLHGVEVPHSLTAQNTWWQVLVEGVKLEEMRHIITEIMDIYSREIQVMA